MLSCHGPSNSFEPVRQVMPFIVPSLRPIVQRFLAEGHGPIEEIRLRLHRPLIVEADGHWMLKPDGGVTVHPGRALIVSEDDIRKTLELSTASSLYTVEEEMRQGFITLPGGHRVGLSGECIVRHGRLHRLRNVTGINIRIAQERLGIAAPLLPWLWKDGRFFRTLIISPPRAGKTTLLRDLVRGISDGDYRGNSAKVGLVDERNEIAGSFHGVPQLKIGMQTDLLAGCPKVEGIYLLLRTMSPDVIAVDELGHGGETEALRDLLYAGVSVLATAHADSIHELRKRSMFSRLLRHGGFQRLVLLSRRFGAGTVETVWDEVFGQPMLSQAFRLGEER